MRFVKGHGTENDFVILPDVEGELDISAAMVAALCHRRAGIGADGVLHVVPTRLSPEVADQADQAEWFMDYRNADGSMAEMCGNGIRVFARYLAHAGLVEDTEFLVATRAGAKRVWLRENGDVTVDMGLPRILGESTAVVAGQEYRGLHVDMGNPHLACVIGEPVAQLDLTYQPAFDPAVYPHGVNVELLNPVGEQRLVMRVHERGSGETRSCGTGAVAAAVAAAHQAGRTTGEWTVELPGGLLQVELGTETSYLTGPAVLVAEGYTTLPLD